MAEPIAVLGAFSSGLQIVECTAKIVSRTYKLARSGHDTLQESERLEALANEYRSLGQVSTALTGSTDGFNPSASTSDGHTEDEKIKESEYLANDYDKLHRGLNRLKKVEARTETEKTISRLGSQCEVESQRLLEHLGALTIDPKAKGGRRLAKALRVAVKSLHKRQEIDQCRQNLQELNGQLATAILQALLKERTRSFDLPLSGDDFDGPDDVQNAILLMHRSKQDFIIKSLWFDDFTTRRDAIDNAYPATYEWALKNDFTLETWLRDGSGIFWITGKAGSGKSTLMKFLRNHRAVQSLLGEWSSEEKLVISSFFFWYAGTRLQKSIPGLLRTILHQIVSYDRSLVEVAFPDRFNALDLDRGGNYHADEWTHDELVAGVKLIASHNANSTARKRFCLFIDGLDEYHGDHLGLIALLNDLASNPDIKLCVSSRPWNAFRNTFGTETPQLRLEDLSRPDIYRYTTERIHAALALCPIKQSLEHQDQVRSLIDEIATKADGVFLWVALVVQSVIRGLAEGDPIFMLHHRVQQFPAELEEFFEYILGRVESVYKSQTCQALSLAFMFADAADAAVAGDEEDQEEDGKVDDDDVGMSQLSTFVDFWLIGRNPNGLSDTAFAYTLPLTQLSHAEVLAMINRTRTMLCSACKDLLCIPKIERRPLATKVDFLHRTAYDFLSNDKIQQLLKHGVPDHFKDRKIFHLLNLARIKFKVADSESEASDVLKPIEQGDISSTIKAPAVNDSESFGDRYYTTESRECRSRLSGAQLPSSQNDDHLEHDLSDSKELSRAIRDLRADLEKVGRLSIETLHDDLCERYLEEFAAAVTLHNGTDGLFRYLMDKPRQMSRFCAFPRLNIALKCIETAGADRYMRQFSEMQRLSFLFAALGEDEVHKFGVNEVNIALINVLCRADDWTYDRVDENRCFSGWASAFFRKWAIFVSQPSDSCMSTKEAKELVRSLWEVTKVILQYSRVNLQDEFCAATTPCSGRNHQHRKWTVGKFLKTHVPGKLLHKSLVPIGVLTQREPKERAKQGRPLSTSFNRSPIHKLR